MTPAERRTHRRARRERLLPVAVVILALLMGGQYVYLLSGVSQRAQCQQDERGRLAALSDDNQNRLILGVAKLTTTGATGKEPTKAQRARTQAQYRALFASFTADAAQIAADRQALAERKVCG